MPAVPKPVRKTKNPKKKRRDRHKGVYGRNIPKHRREEVLKRDKGWCIYSLLVLGIKVPADDIHHIVFRSHASRKHVHDLCNLISLSRNIHNLIHNSKNGAKIRCWCEEWMIQNYGITSYQQVKKVA